MCPMTRLMFGQVEIGGWTRDTNGFPNPRTIRNPEESFFAVFG